MATIKKHDVESARKGQISVSHLRNVSILQEEHYQMNLLCQQIARRTSKGKVRTSHKPQSIQLSLHSGVIEVTSSPQRNTSSVPAAHRCKLQLRKRDNNTHTSTLNSFLSGVGSILNIAGNYYDISPTIKSESTHAYTQMDKDAIASDWATIVERGKINTSILHRKENT